MFNRAGIGIFQFHKGTIKTSHIRLSEHSGAYFNSIKVQLRLSLMIDILRRL